MQKPIISLTLAYLAGLLLGHGFLFLPYSISILACIILLILIVLAWRKRFTLRRLLFIVIGGSIGMAAYLSSVLWLPANHYVRIVPDDKAIHEMTGTIASPLDRDFDRTAFVMDLSDIDGTPVTGKIRVSAREALTSIGYGDVIRVSGRIFEPRGFHNPRSFDYAAYLAQNGIYRAASVKSGDQVLILRSGKGIFRTIQDWRERIRQAFLASTHGPGSAIIQAMVLGEEGGLTDEIRDQFMAAGVTHIISISGSHLGMLAILCFGLVRALMRLLPERHYLFLTIQVDPRKVAALMTLPLVVFYTLLAGGQVATVRSLMMIAAALAALLLDRENALMHSLATAALLILLAGPQALFDISFQLSFISVLSIGYIVMLWSELGIKAQNTIQKLRNNAVLLIVISLAASIATGPLVAHYFNQVSFTGIISNMIVVPFAGLVVVPIGLFSGVLSLFTHHLPMAALNQHIADLFIGTVAFFSRLPFAEFHPPSPGIVWLLCYGVLVMVLSSVIRSTLLYRFKPLEYSSRTSRVSMIMIALAGTALLFVSAHAILPTQGVEVSFPDVGQGDSALIRLPTGNSILVDGGGTYDDRFDIGRRVLAPWLWNKGIRRLDLVILSHPHPDHMNGLKFILKKFNIAEVWTHGQDADLPGYKEFSRLIAERGIRRKIVSADGPPVLLGGAELRVLHPARAFRSHERKTYSAENDRSLVVRIAFPGPVLLFTGDIGTAVEKELIRSGQGLQCDLLKVPHHGSKSSSSEAFVRAARAAAAVVTAGRGNPYHHPSDDVLARYENIGTRMLRTDRDGAISLFLDRGALEAVTWNERELNRTSRAGRASLWEQERENVKRMYLRKWEL
jgi:competence protein ComEC